MEKLRKSAWKKNQSVSGGNFPTTGGKMFDAIHILSQKFKCKFQYVGMTVKILKFAKWESCFAHFNPSPDNEP